MLAGFPSISPPSRTPAPRLLDWDHCTSPGQVFPPLFFCRSVRVEALTQTHQQCALLISQGTSSQAQLPVLVHGTWWDVFLTYSTACKIKSKQNHRLVLESLV